MKTVGVIGLGNMGRGDGPFRSSAAATRCLVSDAAPGVAGKLEAEGVSGARVHPPTSRAIRTSSFFRCLHRRLWKRWCSARVA